MKWTKEAKGAAKFQVHRQILKDTKKEQQPTSSNFIGLQLPGYNDMRLTLFTVQLRLIYKNMPGIPRKSLMLFYLFRENEK